MNNIKHFLLPENTNTLYKLEARSSISLARDVAEKINELVDAYNKFSKTDIEWKQEQEGTIRGAILYLKDNLANTLDDMMLQLNKSGFVDDRIQANLQGYKDEVATLNARLNNLLGSVKTGSTTMDAEIIDGRTGADNKKYASLGEAIREQIKNGLRGSGVQINATNYTQHFTSVNNAAANVVYLINSNVTNTMISGLPASAYGKFLLLLTLNYNPTNEHGKIQICVEMTTNKMYIRSELGSTTASWTNWSVMLKDTEALQPYNVLVSANNYTSILTDVNNARNNTMYVINSNISNSMVANLPKYYSYCLLVTLNGFYTQAHGKTQILFYSSGEMYWRFEYGTDSDPIWSEWNKTVSQKELENKIAGSGLHTADIFRKVVCCGDSFTSGHVALGSGTTTTNEAFAYPSFMARLTGNDYINCGQSGANVQTWLTSDRGLAKAQTSGKAQAYIIGLGLNDSGTGSASIPVGVVGDIGTENNTYYAGLSKIIREINSINPTAKIFITTIPKPATSRQPYNEAMRKIVEAYKNTYPIHLLDLDKYAYLYDVDSINNDYIGGHYTAISYQQFAENLRYIMSDYINHNISAFQDVHLIPFDL